MNQLQLGNGAPIFRYPLRAEHVIAPRENNLDCCDSFTGIFAEAGNPKIAKFHPLHACVVKDVFGFDVLMKNFELKQKIAQGDLHLPVDSGEQWGFEQPAPGKKAEV